ncbi:MAG TPA: hypothetical protein VGC33_20185, partial [Acerihabitans sp.]
MCLSYACARLYGGLIAVNVIAIPEFIRDLLKNKPIGLFLPIKPCQAGESPYNAPPLTGNKRLRGAGSGREKRPAGANKSLTLQRENVIY